MKLNLKARELAEIISGRLVKGGSYIIRSFSTDTRQLKPGGVFWALKGENYDANDFLHKAVEKKAAGIICREGSIKPEISDKLDFAVETKDTLEALQKLAAWHISKMKIPVISVTGSNGKTTTKEMIKHILSRKAPAVSNFGNFNNRFGLPLSVLETQKKHKFAVFELGASQRGDVARLAKIIRPDISVITTIGPEHLEFFKNMENILKTETEAAYLLKPQGKVIYNCDNPWLKKFAKNYRKEKLSFGFSEDASLRVIQEEGRNFFLLKGKRLEIKLKTPGKHNLLNAAAAFLAALSLGISRKDAIEALADFPGVRMRMQIINYGNSKIIFDAYNSNPQSLESFLEETAGLAPQYLFLGDMKELGRFSQKYHRETGKKLLSRQAEMIILIGGEMREAAAFLKGKKENVKYFKTAQEAELLAQELFKRNKKAFFLFKGSRSVRLEDLLPEKAVKETALKH